VAAAREVLELTQPLLSLKYPQLREVTFQALKNLPVVGVVSLGDKKDHRPFIDEISEVMKNDLGISFDIDRHIPVFVPKQTLGPASYVIFELPSITD
jgi:hypothetical protein